MSSQHRARMSLMRKLVIQENSDAIFTIGFLHGVSANWYNSSTDKASFIVSSVSIFSKKSLTLVFIIPLRYSIFKNPLKVDQYPDAEFRVIRPLRLSFLALSRYSRNLLHRSMSISSKVHLPCTKFLKWR